MTQDPFVSVRGVSKTYRGERSTIGALRDVLVRH